MGSGWLLSRRTLLQSFLGWWCVRRTLAFPQKTIPEFPRAARFLRRYRVDATVLVCGIPILTRKGVGGGYAAVEIGATSGANAVALQFAAGSWPDRASGLNRFGILREIVIARPAQHPELKFAGLITASKEEDLSEARKALHSSASRAQAILVRGLSTNGRLRTWTEAAEIPLEHTWVEAAELLGALMTGEPRDRPRESALKGATTFLAAMRCAALNAQSVFVCPFVHDGNLYSLETSRRPGMPGELAGTIRNGLGQKPASFRVFYETGDESGIPIRIEYRAKSFLRLVFESEPESTQPPIASQFSEETV